MKYDQTMEQRMKAFYDSLSERDRRRYAAIEALKLGHGGKVYIADILECDPKTIERGIADLDDLPDWPEEPIRKPGGGRKRCLDLMPQLEPNFLKVLRDFTAGDPMKEEVKWTNLTLQEIADRLAEMGTPVSVGVVRQLLKKHKFKKRKAKKARAMGTSAFRNDQFENIARLKEEYMAAGEPVISMDTKKKEYIGNYYRDGYLYSQTTIETNDHDFGHAAEGVMIPHGIYDLQLNKGYMHLGVSADTSAFACDSIRCWWENHGQYDYPQATSILTLCDSGGSNDARHYIFKEDLQHLVNDLGIEIRIAHYPPYTSKYNPIEHRLFPHITRACQGVIFRSIALVKQLMEKAKTKTGLSVNVSIIDKLYETGRQVAEGFKENMKLIFDDFLPQWNYKAVPQT